MKGSRIIIAAGALFGSCALHAAGFGYGFGQDDVEIAGGAPIAPARLGNSFEDMISGAAPAPNIEDVTTPVETDTAPPTTPETSLPATEVVEATPQAETAQTEINQTGETITSASAPDLVSPVVMDAALRPEPTEIPPPPPPTITAAPPPPTERLSAEEPVEVKTPDSSTVRPEARPERRRPQQQASAPSRQGGETQQRRGQDNGQQAAQATQSSTQQNQSRSQAAGNAAAENYGGVVYNQISRRRRNAPARGEVTVAFQITASGALGGVRVVKSSGHPGLDAAAVAHIQRAAPFPPPPPGAERRFGYVYVGR